MNFLLKKALFLGAVLFFIPVYSMEYKEYPQVFSSNGDMPERVYTLIAQPLQEAFVNGDYPRILEIMDSKEVDPNFQFGDGATLLHKAVQANSAESVNFSHKLIERGALIDAFDKEKQTPLFYALNKASLAQIGLLLEKKAHFDLFSKDGLNGVGLALRNAGMYTHKEYIEAFDLLLKNGASIENNNCDPCSRMNRKFIQMALNRSEIKKIINRHESL